MPLLELTSICVGYARNRVLHDVNLTLEQGEIVTLVGANGAGKSTLAKSISGLMRPESGKILLAGEPIHSMSPAERLRKGIAHVPEGRQIFSGLSVVENLLLGAYLTSEGQKADRLLFVFGLFPTLEKRKHDMAGNFSGGQQQMLAIARGLMSNPHVLVLDEPSLGIAPLLVAEIFEMIGRLRNEGIAILLAEQNARQALAMSDRGYVFENGRVVLSGPSRELLDSPEVAERYLGGAGGGASTDASVHELSARLREALGKNVENSGRQ
jgi:branched-chain amino acid transport system ATP-binding protein